MSHHVGGTLPGGTSVYADYRQPIAEIMRRQLIAAQHGVPADPGDAELIAEWAVANPQDVCSPPFDDCKHGPADPEPFTPGPYRRPGTTLF